MSDEIILKNRKYLPQIEDTIIANYDVQMSKLNLKIIVKKMMNLH